jgi:hypothetical protein
MYGGKPSEDGGVKQDTTALECYCTIPGPKQRGYEVTQPSFITS